MSNRKKVASIAFTGAAVTAVTMMGAAPAFAGGPFQIKNGAVGYTGALLAKNKAGTKPVLVDVTKNTTLKCSKAFESGSITQSAGNVPAHVGYLNGVFTKWSSCAGPFGLMFKAHLVMPPKIILSTASAVAATGKLSENKISAVISGLGLFAACKATISGTSVPVKYINATHSVSVNPASKATLTVKSAKSCAGTIAAGDRAYFKGIYHVSRPAALTIS